MMSPITFTILLLIPQVLGQSAGNCGFQGFGGTHCIGNHYSVANRRAGTISVVNPQTLTAVNAKLTDGGEPMHITTFEVVEKVSRYAELWVGDRNNSRLVIYRMVDNDLQYNGFIPINGGAFSTMSTELYPQVRRPLAITTCDITKVALVHDMFTRQLKCKFETPSNIINLGGKPHGATLTITHAFVSYVGSSDGNGFVASYSLKDCQLVALKIIAQDPNLSVREGANLWVAAQGGKVLQLKTPGLETLKTYSLPSPHGIFMSYDNKRVYVLNIGTGGKDVVHVFEQNTGNKISCPVVDTTHPTPNNVALSYENDHLFISHGIAGKSFNSVWAINTNTGCVDPSSEKVFLTGDLPFGVRVIPPFGNSARSLNIIPLTPTPSSSPTPLTVIQIPQVPIVCFNCATRGCPPECGQNSCVLNWYRCSSSSKPCCSGWRCVRAQNPVFNGRRCEPRCTPRWWRCSRSTRCCGGWKCVRSRSRRFRGFRCEPR